MSKKVLKYAMNIFALIRKVSLYIFILFWGMAGGLKSMLKV
jgi:hypothetical protein